MDKIKPNFSILAKTWPSPFVARQQIENFSGGILNSKSLANLDSLGHGPRGRFKVGRKVAYPVSAVIAFLESRCKFID
jgi:hypothetical protein